MPLSPPLKQLRLMYTLSVKICLNIKKIFFKLYTNVRIGDLWPSLPVIQLYYLQWFLVYFRYWQVPYYWAGIKMYDFVAGKQRLKSSYFLSKKKALEKFPMLKRDKLVGALVYFDGKYNGTSKWNNYSVKRKGLMPVISMCDSVLLRTGVDPGIDLNMISSVLNIAKTKQPSNTFFLFGTEYASPFISWFYTKTKM